MIFTEFDTNLGINFEKTVDFNSAYLFSRGVRPNPSDTPPPPPSGGGGGGGLLNEKKKMLKIAI